MAEEGEVEIIDSGVQNAGPPKQNSMTETGALVEVAFQKDPYQKNKYLEAEPKALGITQIMLSLFLMSIRYAISGNESMAHLIFGGLSLFGLIAGGVAVGAQNLHLPTLKACLGVQVVMCVVSVFCMITNLGTEFESPGFRFCWRDSQNSTSGRILCGKLLGGTQETILDSQSGTGLSLRKTFTKAPVLQHPDPEEPFFVGVDTSEK
ncbi:uncharacterized protein LOC113584716 isoform X3 [Electrophorus electricus]|nr:uncharacterized protein LOC113584716 isoform X3 [Electrophorus electricus]